MRTKIQNDLIKEAVELILDRIDNSFISPLTYMDDGEYSQLESDLSDILKTLCEDYSIEEVEKYL